MHINAISSGQGAPSTFLIVLAGMGFFPADYVIVADTGDEKQLLASNGKRYDASEYFEEITKPLSEEFGIKAHFVRSKNGEGVDLPDISDDQRIGKSISIDLPMFGRNGGRLMQSCTSKWKIAAIRQKLRELGATTATNALGMTLDEVHRLKKSDVKWAQNVYPLVQGEEKYYRATIQNELKKMGIPYLIHTQCNICPHKDYWRWKATDPKEFKKVVEFEKKIGKGEFFLTDKLIPLDKAFDLMKSRKPPKELFDNLPCGSTCGI